MLGGGSSGYFAALAIQRRFPDLEVTVIASSKVPIIGVGEATTTLMPPFLHAQLGLSMEAMCRAVEPTFKLGIRFEWGQPGADHFNFPFGDADPLLAHHFDGDLRHQSLMSMAMDQGLAPVLRGPEGEVVSLLRQVKFAYHLDNAPFVAFLAEAARAAGIGHIDATICDASTRAGASGEPEIASLRTEDGRELAYDLYIDASGFRSVLLGGALEERFQSYASSLFCDRAVIADVTEGAGVEPYTTAETMDAGWCWRIPVRRACHRGYVYSSAFHSDDEAAAHMRAANPSMGEAQLIRFRSGRRERAWVGNVVAVGNAYGFVEPLESTALHMVIVELAYVLGGIEALRREAEGGGEARTYLAFANESLGAHWDYLRWFLAVHYKFNQRRDSAFWRAARAEVDVSGLEQAIARFQSQGPWLAEGGQAFAVGDPAFGYSGLMTMLLGQRVESPVGVAPKTKLSRAQWRERIERQRTALRYAVDQPTAWALLEARPELLREFEEHPSSWCRADAERVEVIAADPRRVRPKSGMPGGRVGSLHRAGD